MNTGTNQSKRFKEWDKRFTREELDAERARWLDSTIAINWTRWLYKVSPWSSSQIQEAVYHSIDAKDWQRFRVCMKGCTTQEKLYMLSRYWARNEHSGWRVQCRVDNYIGALVRGGQLNTQLEIVR